MAQGRLISFLPDYSYLGLTGRFTTAMLNASSQAAESLNLRFRPVYLRYTYLGKALAMAEGFAHGGLWHAAPVLNHFTSNETLEARPGDKILVGFQINWEIARRVVRNIDQAEVFLIVHNIEWKCRESRRSTNLPNRLLPPIEKWNIESLRRLDYELANCHIGCVSWHDQRTLEEMRIPSRSLSYVGWTTLLDDDDIALARQRLSGGSPRAARTLTFFANGENPDNRAGLAWFMERVVPAIREPHLWKLILVGPDWQTWNVPSPMTVVRTGFRRNASEILEPGMIGINPDISGVGVKTKMLDYTAIGLPAVSTPLGVRGMPPEAADQLNSSDEPARWAAILDELQHPESWKQCSRSMLNVFSKYAGREVFVKRLCDLLTTSTGSGTPDAVPMKIAGA